jgi:protein O-mannosyl-transferase
VVTSVGSVQKKRGSRSRLQHADVAAQKSSVWRQLHWVRVASAVATLSALVFIAYANSFSNGFVWDDNRQIVMNPDLRSGVPWVRLFSSDVWSYTHSGQPAHANYYRPLQMVCYRVTAVWLGLQAQYFHILSVVFALAAVLAAFAVYLKLTQRLAIAFAAAALFAVYPVHSEAVDWVSALPELGCAIFVLIAFALFLSIRPEISEAPKQSRILAVHWGLLCLSLLAFATALLWKETAMVFPVLIAAYVICLGAGSSRKRLRSSAQFSLPYWFVLAGYIVLRFRVLGFFSTKQRIWELTPAQFGLSTLHLMALYCWKLIFPIHLNAYYVFSPVRSILGVGAILAILFLLLACLTIAYAFRRDPLSAFAALWVFITLLPVMNIYGLGRNVFAERYVYLPSVGFCLLGAVVASSAIKRLPQKVQTPLSALCLAAVVLGFSWETFARNPDWHDDATLFRKTLATSPDAPFVNFMVAAAESDKPAELQSAEAHYLRAIELAGSENPPDLLDLARSDKGLASLYSDRGEYPHALEVLHQWREVVPNDPELDAEEGLILLKSGHWQDAEPVLNRAFAATPRDENVLNALGLLAWEHKRNLEEAKKFFTRALAVHTAKDDFQASLYNNLGGVYGDLQQFPLAKQQFDSAIAIAPEDPEYHTNLAVALAEMNRYEEAAAEVKTALRISPAYAPARSVLQQLQHR